MFERQSFSLSKLKKIILKPLYETPIDIEMSARWQVMNEEILRHVSPFAKQKKIDLQIDLSNLAKPADEKRILSQADFVMKKALQMFLAVNVRIVYNRLEDNGLFNK